MISKSGKRRNGYCPSSEIFEDIILLKLYGKGVGNFGNQLYNTRELLFLALFTKHAFLNGIKERLYFIYLHY